jgi:hypothetical protein
MTHDVGVAYNYIYDNIFGCIVAPKQILMVSNLSLSQLQFDQSVSRMFKDNIKIKGVYGRIHQAMEKNERECK